MNDFDSLQLLLARAEAAIGASECQGIFSGLVAAGSRDAAAGLNRATLDELDRTNLAVAELELALADLTGTWNAAIAEEPLAFRLLLPSDEAPMALRAEHLAAWCQGLLYGFGLADTIRQTDLSEEVREFLVDLYNIAQLDAQSEAELDGEEAETAYSELVEYVRVGLTMLVDEIAAKSVGARLH